MAEKIGGDFGFTRVATGDLSATQFKLVTVGAGTNFNDVFVPTSGTQCVGVLQNKPRHRENAAIIGFGYTKLFLGSSLGQMTEYGAGNGGAATLASSGMWTNGIILSAGNSGEIVDATVAPGYRKTV